MFVRYRKIIRDGLEPHSVQAKIGCLGQCKNRQRWTLRGGSRLDEHCPCKPRCRWRVGLDPEAGLDLALTPYRLQVQLIENRRDGGRVRQEHVATLGAIDGWLLPEFWDGVDPAVVAKIKEENWDTASVRARIAFWEAAKPRLERLANRIDPKAIRMEIHRRIPWPMQVERERAEACSDYRFWKGHHDFLTKQAERQQKLIDIATEEKRKCREGATEGAVAATQAAERLARLQK